MTPHITATDDGVAVCPWQPVLERALTVIRRTRAPAPTQKRDGGISMQTSVLIDEQPMWFCDAQKHVGITVPGFLDAVMDTLSHNGIAYTFEDHRTPCTPPQWELLGQELRPGQDEVLQMLCRERNGIIKAATGLGKTESIVQFLRVNPDLRVAVLTFSGKVRDSIYRRIRDGAPNRSICVLKSNQPFALADTYILLDKSLHKLDPDSIDVMLIDEVHGAGSPRAFEHLLLYTSKRIYGFSATPVGRHDKADAAAVALCGPMRVELDYNFSVQTGSNVPITALIYDAPGPDNLKGKPDWLREKLGIWHNHRRNRLIAHLCAQLCSEEQTVILCRSLEHVLMLHKLLPEYTCVFRNPNPERAETLIGRGHLQPGWAGHPLFRTDDRIEEEFRTGQILKVICTPVWREGVDFPWLRWVVRADGTANEIAAIQIGGRGSRRIAGEKEWACIIDFWDNFSGFEERSKKRVRRYKKEGWQVEHIRDGQSP